MARLFAGFKSAAWHEEAKAARNQNRRRQLAVSAARRRQKHTNLRTAQVRPRIAVYAPVSRSAGAQAPRSSVSRCADEMLAAAYSDVLSTIREQKYFLHHRSHCRYRRRPQGARPVLAQG